MLAAERRHAIAELIRRQSTVRLKELSETLQASESTIRRDLEHLEEQGLLERTYGGALIVQQSGNPARAMLSGLSVPEERIGAAAAERIQEGETVFLGAGRLSLGVAYSTCAHDSRSRSLPTRLTWPAISPEFLTCR